jgi:hypothetical protein
VFIVQRTSGKIALSYSSDAAEFSAHASWRVAEAVVEDAYARIDLYERKSSATKLFAAGRGTKCFD